MHSLRPNSRLSHVDRTIRLLRLAVRNLAGNSFRSWVVFFCAALMSGFVISSTLVIRGADNSLRLALERLGADIIVIPEGHEQRLESALLMGIPVHCWMPDTVTAQVGAIAGVTAASPQLYLRRCGAPPAARCRRCS